MHILVKNSDEGVNSSLSEDSAVCEDSAIFLFIILVMFSRSEHKGFSEQ